MSQCVPNWDLDDGTVPTRFDLHPRHSSSTFYSGTLKVPTLDYEMAELVWENGQLSMHGLGLPRVSTKQTKHQRERPPACPGTLESIVNLATQKPPPGNAHISNCADVDLVPWFDRRSHHSHPQHHQSFGGTSAGKAAAMTMDALVPCATTNEGEQEGEGVPVPVGLKGVSTCVVESSTRVDSCSGPDTWEPSSAEEDEEEGPVPSSVARVPVAGEWSGEHSVSASVGRSDTFGGDSRRVPTLDTCEREVGWFEPTSTSFCSQGNTFSSSQRPGMTNTTSVDDHDSVCHTRPQKRETGKKEDRKKGPSNSSISTKRSRTVAIHNQSDRKRQDKINQKMKTLQKLVPNSSKTDKSSMLDEVIDHVKQLQAQVQMMSRMTIPSMMMMPLAMQQQQLHMSMMAPMAMGMGMGMGNMGMGMDIMNMNMNMNMNINPMASQSLALAGLAPVINPTAAFMPMSSWDVTANRLLSRAADPISNYLAYQSQPMTTEAYSRMVSLIQQQQQRQASSLKNGRFCS